MSAERFMKLFSGNPLAHYTRANGEYKAETRGIVLADIERHLAGREPALLSIPIKPDDNCYFGAIDADRHGENDPPIDHAALARRVTELGLPLIVTRSKSPKSAHLWLFLKDKLGFSAAIVRQLLMHYAKVLGITGEI